MVNEVRWFSDRPMPMECWRMDFLVRVPVWSGGEVIGWAKGYIRQIRVRGAKVACVPVADAASLVERHEVTVIVNIFDIGERLFYPYSVECGVCAGDAAVVCPQCVDANSDPHPYRRAA